MNDGIQALSAGARCALTIRAQPGARRVGFAGFWNGLVKVAVTAPPEDGRANDALRDAVAELLGVRASAVALVAGATSREKRFEIDAAEALVRARIDTLRSRADVPRSRADVPRSRADVPRSRADVPRSRADAPRAASASADDVSREDLNGS